MSDVITQNALRRQARLDPVEIDPVTLQAVPMVTFEVDVVPTHLVFYGQILEAGKGRIVTIPETMVDGLSALVEDATPEQLAAVKIEHEAHIAECERAACGAGTNTRSYEPNYPAAFHHVLRRSPRPIVAMRKIGAKPQAKSKGGE